MASFVQGSTRAGQKRIFGGALALAAMLLVPVAIAWACNPQARIALDRATYEPGQQVTVQGNFFAKNQRVDLRLSPGGAIGSVTTSGNGTFRQSFKMAEDARGAYTLTATAVTNNGTFQAREAFEVRQPAPAPAPQAPAPQAPAQQSAPAPAPSADREETFSEPGTFSEPSVVQSRGKQRGEPSSSPRRGSSNQGTAPGQGGSSSGSSGSTFGGSGFGGSGTGSGSTSAGSPEVTRLAGRTVFGASAAPAGQAAAAPVFGASAAPAGQADSGSGGVSAAGGRSDGRGASERTAMGDLWSGFAGGRTPSLAPIAGDGAPNSGTGSQLAWGLGLLALGLVGLLSGLAVLEARRRRALS